MGQQSNRVPQGCLLVYPVILPGYLAMSQLGPMLPSEQGLSRLMCDFPRQLAWSYKVRLSIDDHDRDTILIYINSSVKFSHKAPTQRKQQGQWRCPSPEHILDVSGWPRHTSPRVLSVRLLVGSSLYCLMLLALPEPFPKTSYCPSLQCSV